MDSSWDDEYLTVQEIADRLKLNQQTIRNWIDEKNRPLSASADVCVFAGVDLDAMLAQGATVEVEPQASTVAPAETIDQLAQAQENALRLLDRLSGARRAELVEGLQQLTETVAATLQALPDDSSPAAAETK